MISSSWTCASIGIERRLIVTATCHPSPSVLWPLDRSVNNRKCETDAHERDAIAVASEAFIRRARELRSAPALIEVESWAELLGPMKFRCTDPRRELSRHYSIPLVSFMGAVCGASDFNSSAPGDTAVTRIRNESNSMSKLRLRKMGMGVDMGVGMGVGMVMVMDVDMGVGMGVGMVMGMDVGMGMGTGVGMGVGMGMGGGVVMGMDVGMGVTLHSIHPPVFA